jgi:quercetin dioxygenase-like cupin family protein
MTSADRRLFRAVAGHLAGRLEAGAWAPYTAALSEARHCEAPILESGPALPVLRHLPEALRAARAHAPEIVAALPGTSQPWVRIYRDSEWSSPFNDDVAVLEVAGPGAVMRTARGTLGLMVCAPGLDYPRHAHPAAELYVALSAGGAVERDAHGVWHSMGPGDVSLHPPDTSHAFRTGTRPVLVAYAWQGDVAAATWWKHDMTDDAEARRETHRAV